VWVWVRETWGRTVCCEAEHYDGEEGLDCAQRQYRNVEERHVDVGVGVYTNEDVVFLQRRWKPSRSKSLSRKATRQVELLSMGTKDKKAAFPPLPGLIRGALAIKDVADDNDAARHEFVRHGAAKTRDECGLCARPANEQTACDALAEQHPWAQTSINAKRDRDWKAYHPCTLSPQGRRLIG
jgi:hypothetical protein